ncbi:hypothetical protein DFR26_0524 [Paraperlucidibaca baekdonensis]|uniref:Uncharacterized protein n=1 Tax=Paraperlucidibaca baekdonensis TaxID=748120 RepID=A0A3E0H9J5_9GAMM|nr:hypothetical protein DFR26_0524 [Paraperlucidibaca baekdonensis]
MICLEVRGGRCEQVGQHLYDKPYPALVFHIEEFFRQRKNHIV